MSLNLLRKNSHPIHILQVYNDRADRYVNSDLIRFRFSVFSALRCSKSELCPPLRLKFLILRQIVFSEFLRVVAKNIFNSTLKADRNHLRLLRRHFPLFFRSSRFASIINGIIEDNSISTFSTSTDTTKKYRMSRFWPV